MNGSKTRFVNWGRLYGLMIAAVAVLAYSNSFSGSWIYDDVHTISKAIESETGETLLRSERPITDSTFTWNWQLGGGKAADFHAVNLAIHIGCALLLFGLVRRLLGRTSMVGWGGYGQAITVTAAITAALWVVHPLTTSAVTYISQRYEVLMSLFYLATLYAVVRGASASGRLSSYAWYLLAIVTCLLGMGSKEVMITAPVAVALCDWMFLSKGNLPEMRPKRAGLYIGLMLSWVLLFVLMQQKQVESAEYYAYGGITALEYAATEFGVICRYLRLAAWPSGLCFDYGWSAPASFSTIFAPALAIGTILAITMIGIVRGKQLAFPMALFFLTLAPTSTFVARPDPIMEHRMYLALAWLLTYAIVGVVGSGRLAVHRGLIGKSFARMGGTAIAVLAIALLMFTTRQRNAVYHSDFDLWQATLRSRPSNVRARLGLGSAAFRSKDNEKAQKCFEGVLSQIRAGLAGQHAYIRTVEAQAHNNLGSVYFRQKRFDEAVAEFEAALALFPNYEKAQENLKRAVQAAATAPVVELPLQ